MALFVGRRRYLDQLERDLEGVRSTGDGRFVLVRGRRRIGKSRLVQHFLGRQDTPYVYFQARRRPPREALRDFQRAVADSTLPGAELFAGGTALGSWQAAMRLIAQQASAAGPAVIVIDEIPYLLAHDPDFDSELQDIWDNELQHHPVLLIAIGSDLSVMEGLTGHGRALFQRPTREMLVDPLTPAEIAELLDVSPLEALDAYLIVGGFPLLAGSWPAGARPQEYLREQLSETGSPLVYNAARILSSELGESTRARYVLEAIGHGDVTFATIRQRSGLAHDAEVNETLRLLHEKRIVRAVTPIPAKRNTRHQLVDPYLRFWLRFIGAEGIEEIDRGRTDLVLDRIARDWATYRGKAVEPLVRDALTRLLPNPAFGSARYVGGYWTRTNSVEVDLVGVETMRQPAHVAFVGSIKWKEAQSFDRADSRALAAQRVQVPLTDATTKLVGVSRSGFSGADLDVELGPEELLAAWEETGARRS